MTFANTNNQNDIVEVNEETGRDNLGRFALQLKTAKAVKRSQKQLAKLESNRQSIIEANREWCEANNYNPENADMLWA